MRDPSLYGRPETNGSGILIFKRFSGKDHLRDPSLDGRPETNGLGILIFRKR
jgi:hypothetical protein